jgi:hypothetical protein
MGRQGIRGQLQNYQVSSISPKGIIDPASAPAAQPGFARPPDASTIHATVDKSGQKPKGPTPPSGEMEPSTLIHPSRAMANQRGAPGSRG